MKDRIAFLFLGETLLIPHLYPIVEALSAASDVPIDLWVSTSTHEALLSAWLPSLPRPTARIRRAPGFRVQTADSMTLDLPPKLPMLARLIPAMLRTSVVVCAEQTSLWLPTLLPLPCRFVKTSHGVGSMSARDDRRRRSPWLTLVPSERERQTYLDRGFAPDRILATGYVKSAFRQRSQPALPFAEPRPVLLYTPHWQAHRSSWPLWGAGVVRMLAAQDRFNVILAPHQRLIENAPEIRPLLAEVAGLPHVHADLDSFAMIDGSYTAAADIYLGDTSSQVIEFLARPRPCVFLNAQNAAWRGDPSYAQWACGEVIEEPDQIFAALMRASESHPIYRAAQEAYARASLGDTEGGAPARAAAAILDALGGRLPRSPAIAKAS
ncbi:hypothetical protein [Flavisphingomonas formosensis]|uniref:hypothetical protein n=1 Tax=Flavisphingomonas formosensis TaxID=861534 RepID=UPI0012F8D73A|nr:hypothetical protein [Sphingomonas formosensis]